MKKLLLIMVSLMFLIACNGMDEICFDLPYGDQIDPSEMVMPSEGYFDRGEDGHVSVEAAEFNK